MKGLNRSINADRWLSRFCWLITATTVLSCGENELTEPLVKEPLPAASLAIRPDTATLLIREVAHLSAITRDALGNEVSTVNEWSSADPSVATIGRMTGAVTGVGVGSTIVTVSTQGLFATARITVLEHHPAVRILISPTDLILQIGKDQRVTAVAVDIQGRSTPVPIEWTSENPGVATIGRTDGLVSAVAVGSTMLIAAAGSARASIPLDVVPENFLMQWAMSATASSEYYYGYGGWTAAEATGAPNMSNCEDWRAWASAGPSLDWIELQYQTPVRPAEIHIYEFWAPGAIIKVEVGDLAGTYHTIFTATAKRVGAGCLQRTLKIPVSNFNDPVSRVRVTVDQSVTGDWNEIDAVRLLGYRIN